MENLSAMKKFKTMISCFVVAFVAVLVLATVSFVQVGKARRANAEYDKQLEQVLAEESALKEDIEYLESEEGKDETARDNNLLPEGEYEITTQD